MLPLPQEFYNQVLYLNTWFSFWKPNQIYEQINTLGPVQMC